MQWQTMQQWWGMVVGNTGGDKYETTAREIHLVLFSASGRVTFRKVTPTATTVNEKKILTSPTAQLACFLTDLGVFCPQ